MGAVTVSASQGAVMRMAGDAAALFRSVQTPDRPAIGIWSIGDVAVHMLHVFAFELDVIRRVPLQPIRNFDELARFTTGFVEDEPSRDLRVMADRIESVAAEFAAEADAAPPDAMYDWLGGSRLPLAALHAHILSDCMLHGLDIARAAKLPWVMRPEDAVAALDEFFVPLAAAFAETTAFGGARAFVNQEKGRGVRARFEVRIDGAEPRHFSFDDGSLTVTPRTDQRVDCYIGAEPVTLNLIVWRRASPWPAVARGRLRAWGRKPWLAARLTSLVRTP